MMPQWWFLPLLAYPLQEFSWGICVDERVLLEEEEEEVKDEEGRKEEVEDDGTDLLSTWEDNTHGQYIHVGKEWEVLEQDQHHIQIPIHFVVITGFIPFFRNKFPRLFQDSDWFFKDSKIHINPYTPKISMLILFTASITRHIF